MIEQRLASSVAWLASAAIALAATACGDDGTDAELGAGDAAVGGIATGPVDPSAESVGGFTLRLVPPDPLTDTPGITSVLGIVRDRPPPPLTVWEQAAEEGDCSLEEPRSPFCECPRDQVCVEDGVCVPKATALDAGSVTLSGVRGQDGESSFTLEPLQPINSYQLASGLAYPGYDEGAVVRVEAAGKDDVPAFAMEARGIVPLELDGTDDLPVTPGEALTVAWTAGGETSARIHIEMDISHHGGTRGRIVCDTDDDGELVVSAALVSGLIDLGVSGFPVVDVTRHSDGAAMLGAHRVDLTLDSNVTRGLSLPGVTSCFEDSDCTGGETCQFDMQCG